MNDMTPTQEELDAKLWWTTVRPWLANLTSWPKQPFQLRKVYPKCGTSGCLKDAALDFSTTSKPQKPSSTPQSHLAPPDPQAPPA